MTHRKSGPVILFAVLGACQPFRPAPPPPFDRPQATAISAQGVGLSVEHPRPEDSQSYVKLLVVPGQAQPIRLVLGPGWYLEREADGIYLLREQATPPAPGVKP